jgi:hypothetical protein
MALAARLQRAGRHKEAAAAYGQALALEPDLARAHTGLGIALRAQGKFAAAVACYRRSLQLDADSAHTYSCLGNVLKDLDRLDEAVACHREAVARQPDEPTFHSNLGVALKQRGELEAALAAFERAHAMRPDAAEVEWDLALVRLHLGDFAGGWPAYESRWRRKDHRPRPFRRPQWDGAPLAGRRILLHMEQGFGDAFLASRFIPLVKRRGGTVILEAKPEVARLFRLLDGIDEVVLRGDRLPAFDLHCPLMSLPGIFKTDLTNTPPALCLKAPPAAGRKALALLARARSRCKVGIVWSGSITFKDNRHRAAPLTHFLRFLEVPGVHLFSLQKGPPTAALAALGTDALITDLGPALDDFADTAAVLEALDLVIMTDSAVAHLAGALGRPVWLLLSFMPYWLWGTERADTPWYPTLRLFRQPRRNDWDEVFDRATQALARLIEARR